MEPTNHACLCVVGSFSGFTMMILDIKRKILFVLEDAVRRRFSDTDYLAIYRYNENAMEN